MLRRIIKDLTSKVIMPLTLAGGIMAGMASQESAQAQDLRVPLGLDFMINNPHLGISYNDRVFLNHINRLNFITAHHRYQQNFDCMNYCLGLANRI